ncbi:MAG: DUF4381 domain-containing protein [Alphaproteobacteria bacterium]|nr:DUF4381 domain-containing protein [Alphaproteobacteria bacterium]
MDNLPELRDIHLPADGIPLFPLAYGWWFLLLSLICLIILIKLFIWFRRTSARIYARKLLRDLQNSYNLATVVQMSEILRRVCVHKYPHAVAFIGDEWINFLNNKSKYILDTETSDLLKNAPFMPEDTDLYNKEKQQKLWRFCYDWIGDNL